MRQQYDSYKPSGIDWIGDIPSHWNIRPLKRNLRMPLKYGANEPAESENKNYPRYIRITDIDNNGNLKDETFKSLEPAKATEYLLEKGDVLFARSGATVGKTYIFNEPYEACFAGYLIKASCSSGLTPQFLFYYTNSGMYNNWKNSIFIQSTIQNIGADKYSLLPMPLPPLAEQEAIAAWLDEKCEEIDAAIAKVDREIELIDELKQSEISRVVTRGLNPDAPMRPSGIDWIGDIPAHWKVAPIKNSFILYAGATPKTERAEFWDGDIVWITPADYKTDDHFVKEGRKNITLEGLASCATEIVPIDSLIFSKRAPIGTVAIASIPLCTNQGCISCVPKSISHSNYFYYLCRIATSEFEILGSGATFLEISSSNFANFKMPLPPLSEQVAIADYLDAKCAEIDGLKAKLSKKRETLTELRQSIISEVVTGKRKAI